MRATYVVFLFGSAVNPPSYLCGVLVLAHSLKACGARYPLLVLVTPSVPDDAICVLRNYGLDVRTVEPLLPSGEVTLIAQRFQDTWTKLRVLGMTDYDRIVLLDGDMMLRRNIDELFEMELPPDWMAACHGCICNLDRSWWAPANWTRDTCAYTKQSYPTASTTAAPPKLPPPGTPYLLNSGLVVVTPSKKLMAEAEAVLRSPAHSSWLFPDQDAFGYLFSSSTPSHDSSLSPVVPSPIRWKPLPWVYNALKISRYWHGALWRDEDAANIHYICGKPWRDPPKLTSKGEIDAGAFAEPSPDPIITGDGCDAVTHTWWWRQYFSMARSLSRQDLDVVEAFLVLPDDPTRAVLSRSDV